LFECWLNLGPIPISNWPYDTAFVGLNLELIQAKRWLNSSLMFF